MSSVGYMCKSCGTNYCEDFEENIKNFCDQCWEEKVCNRCKTIYDDSNISHLYCEQCGKHVWAECYCVALCWSQSVDCICRDCIIDCSTKLKCKKCKTKKFVRHFIKNNECLVEDCGDVLICNPCRTEHPKK